MNVGDLIPIGGSNVKSIQRGRIAWNTDVLYRDITINVVDTNKSIAKIKQRNIPTANANAFVWAIELINPTTIRISRNSTGGSNDVFIMEWTVEEYNNVKSKQSGSASISFTDGTGSDATITINPVDINKSISSVSLYTASTTTAPPSLMDKLINSTTLNVWSIFTNSTVKWQVLEFN